MVNNRTYMRITGFYTDWCFFKKLTDDRATSSDIENFINEIEELVDEDRETIKQALRQYFGYLSREHIVK